MDSLIRERNGKDEIWYSEQYLKNQIKMAYNAGLSKGIKVEIHAVQPMNEKAVDDLIDIFNKRREEEYYKSFSDGEVLKITK